MTILSILNKNIFCGNAASLEGLGSVLNEMYMYIRSTCFLKSFLSKYEYAAYFIQGFTTGEYYHSIDACDELMKEEAKVKKRRDTRKCRPPLHCPWRIGLWQS